MEVSHAPTGCMLIKAEVFQKMMKAYPDLKINQKTILNGKEQDHEYMYNFFDTLCMIKKVKNGMEKTLLSVNDGQP
jgi:hypothetical protein